MMDRKELPWAINVEDVALGVVQVMQHGWPPAFIMAYDEAWILAHQVSEIVKYTTGNEMIMDWFAWYGIPYPSQQRRTNSGTASCTKGMLIQHPEGEDGPLTGIGRNLIHSRRMGHPSIGINIFLSFSS